MIPPPHTHTPFFTQKLPGQVTAAKYTVIKQIKAVITMKQEKCKTN